VDESISISAELATKASMYVRLQGLPHLHRWNYESTILA
jgi:hypothetical protein